MSREAMKLALEALEYPGNIWHMSCPKDKAITAIREALEEQPAQHRAWFTVDELNAWADKKLKENPQWEEKPAQVDPCIDGSCSCCWANLDEQSAQQGKVAWTLLLTGENQGLVGKAGEKFVGHPEYYERVDVYTSPQRTWVGLTDEQAVGLYKATETDNRMVLIDAVEAKLKEKNI